MVKLSKCENVWFWTYGASLLLRSSPWWARIGLCYMKDFGNYFGKYTESWISSRGMCRTGVICRKGGEIVVVVFAFAAQNYQPSVPTSNVRRAKENARPHSADSRSFPDCFITKQIALDILHASTAQPSPLSCDRRNRLSMSQTTSTSQLVLCSDLSLGCSES